MATTLHRSKPGAKDVRRIARKEIEKALDALERKAVSDEDVHTARKELKKARAMVRLLRDALGKRAYQRENVALRDAARPLSRVRDSKVLIDALDKLSEHVGNSSAAAAVKQLRQTLDRERKALLRRTLNGGAPLQVPRRQLRSAHRRAEHWHVGRGGWSVLGKGLKRVYANAHQAFATVREIPSDENLHEWRKQSKYLWHQLQVLTPLRPASIGKLAGQLHKLTDYLGDDHDLSVLRGKVVSREPAHGEPSARSPADRPGRHFARNPLPALINQYRTQLRTDALALGHKLYKEDPDAFEQRFQQYWKDWRRS